MHRKLANGNDASMRTRAYIHIQQRIASGSLSPGSALSELALAKELGISRTPIREAIGQLVSEGLLEQIPNRGAAVARLDRQDIVDLYELREALETYAVGKAARGAVRTSDLESLEKLADVVLTLNKELAEAGGRALNAEQMQRFISYDFAFHALLMRMAANARILKVVNETRLLIRIFTMYRSGHSAEELDRIHRGHREILRAVAEHDPERAMRAIAEHIQISGRERLDEYDRWERESSLRQSMPAAFDLQFPAEFR